MVEVSERWNEGRAWITRCDVGVCSDIIIEAHLAVRIRLSQWAVPWRDARVLLQYERTIVNIRPVGNKLYAEMWWPPYGPPDAGWLFAQHVHGLSGKRIPKHVHSPE